MRFLFLALLAVAAPLSASAQAPTLPKPREKVSVPSTEAEINAKMARDLEAVGYLKLASDPAKELRDIRARGRLAVIVGNHNRFFSADAEDLAEGGVGDAVADMNAFFEAAKVAEPRIVDHVSDTGYFVTADGEIFPILTSDEMKLDFKKPGYGWGMAAYRTAQMLNALLKKRGLPEHAYAVEGGNDLFFLLMTPEMYKVIVSAPNNEPTHGPYELTNRYPDFGQPADR